MCKCCVLVFQGDVLVAQAAAFFTAGYETTSTTLSFALFELCRRPDIQDRLRLEIGQLLVRTGASEPTYDDVLGLEYMGMVIAETLRKYPPLPFVDRECTLAAAEAADIDLEPFSAFRVPNGMPIIVPVFSLHRDPKYFPLPDHFDPERFAAANREAIVPYTYLPFGAGPHNCIGNRFGVLQTRLALFNVLRSNRVAAATDGRTPQRLAFDAKALLTTAAGGVWLSVRHDPVDCGAANGL